MKKLGKLKLNQFSKDELDRRKMSALKGGCGCSGNGSCSCGGTSDWSYYSNYGSSNKAYHY